MEQNNLEVKKKCKDSNVPLWRVADKMGISDTTLSKRMCKSFSPRKKQEIFAIIDELAKEAQNADDYE